MDIPYYYFFDLINILIIFKDLLTNSIRNATHPGSFGRKEKNWFYFGENYQKTKVLSLSS